ncbi:winged helix-turn-helix domain-containing protein [Pseudomonas eucalypticola]|uniref:Winged helix-turn-helix domain-containing protein n=1 Tax=Pseudomonas eucalypticola TaxID=2599595 RepID=A0A7D5DAP2_9PSED|nr:crosslink repair DNA glycosylase YcaQ family protein [Pseudomonas eucalypticola]QKZ06115.1 winged helix-turn-helix domain-containing protein [Pseudomonas eucalypticola]
MPQPLSLSIAQARRLALAAQGFAPRPRQSVLAPTHLLQTVQRLGVVQIDSVNALVRSHYLPLFSRLGDYPQALFDELAWGRGRQRKLFEYWGHEASLMPLALYPAMAWRMARAAQGKGIYKELARFGVEQKTVVARVLDTVRERGALGAGSLSTRQERAGPWWDWSAEKHALEWLFAAGLVTVAGRRGFERLYDLPERVLPGAVLKRPALEVGEAHRQLLLHAATALGVATERDLRDYFRLDPGDARRHLAELVEDRQVQRCEVQGWRQPAYCLRQVRIPRQVDASALLSPFDSLVWERDRTERLFDFRYRLEIYTPAHKRVYGYYVLPFLHGERIVARVDVRAARAAGELRVLAVHEEAGGLDEAALQGLAVQLKAMAVWLGLARVRVECQRGHGLQGLVD